VAQLNVVAESVALADGDFILASAGGDTFANDGRSVLWIKNESGAQRIVTIVASGTCSHGFLHNQVLTISASTTLYKTRSFPQSRFGGRTSITYDTASGLQLVAVRQQEYHGT
jgi:ABC-type taurine transport system substrate-binding protein